MQNLLMDLDIVHKIKFLHLKASFQTLALKHKFTIILILVSFVTTLMPHESYATPDQNDQPDQSPVLVFDLSDLGFNDYLDMRSLELNDLNYQEQIRQQAIKRKNLTAKVRAYLEKQGSPLAEYAAVLIILRNWKTIVALANAESSMCRKYPADTANCWGVGGANLWDMGNNLGEGLIAMNHFLNKYPLRSPVKYSQMTFEQMNGLYKQPPADHWLDNNKIIYDDLVAIEKSV